MRTAQMKVAPVEGDDRAGRTGRHLVPRRRRGESKANVARWEKPSSLDADKNVPKAKVETKKGVNVDVTRVEVTGRYVAAMMPGQPGNGTTSPTHRLLGAIVMTENVGYFFKLVGPDKTVAAASKSFDA